MATLAARLASRLLLTKGAFPRAPLRRLSSAPAPPDLRALVSSVTANVAAGKEELRESFGGDHAALAWASSFHAHRLHKYTVPALALIGGGDAAAGQLPTPLAVKHAVFFGALFRSLPPPLLAQYSAALTLAPNVNLALVLASLRVAATPDATRVYDRLAAALVRLDNADLRAVVAQLAAGPAAGAHDHVAPVAWPFPHLGAGSDALALAASTEAWKPSHSAPPLPWEIADSSVAAREQLDGGAWLLLSAQCVLEAQWAEFSATGDRAPLARILDAALPWAEFASMPAAVSYVIAIDKPLPPDVALREGMSPPDALRAVRATIARAALWSLLHNSRMHAGVVEAIAAACGELGGSIACASWKREGGEEGGGDVRWTDAEARERLEVWPALLHLCARGRLDAPQ